LHEVKVQNPGHHLRKLREQLGLTLRDVEAAASSIAARHNDGEFALTLSRISDIETKGVVPSIYRVYSLATIYRQDLYEVLSWYGIDINQMAVDMQFVEPLRSHRNEALNRVPYASIPVRLDPSFDFKKTCNFGRMIEKWGIVPMAYLETFQNPRYTYAYLGVEDLTMYPILLPGSFLQIDESLNKVAVGMWHSEYERPIYFVEMREGFTCCWCSVDGDQITLQSHPLSHVPVRILRYPQQAEIIGQVVGVAMRLDGWRRNELETGLTSPSTQN
jgi:transcriptional regulator with XRE-family HTH domain